MRKLASVRTVHAVSPIANADRIELLTIDGWLVVSKKGEFKEGDKCVYFEIDSILPDTEWSDFMRSRKFRVRTIKLRKQISQGLALPLETVGLPAETAVGTDVTSTLGVTKHDPQAARERKLYSSRKDTKIPWYKTFPVVSSVYNYFYPYEGRQFPPFIRKTDETRVQNIATSLEKLIHDRDLYLTEKLDGMSTTIFYNRKQRHGFRKGLFGVCSRNIWYHKERDDNPWWGAARSSGLTERLAPYCKKRKMSLAIQGELIGPGIQGNPYGLKSPKFYVFNVYDIDRQCYLNMAEKSQVVHELGLELVPWAGTLLSMCVSRDTLNAQRFLEIAEGPSMLDDLVEREGIVVRDIDDDSFSFKAISNKWLLAEED